jgi:hypothetical protein
MTVTMNPPIIQKTQNHPTWYMYSIDRCICQTKEPEKKKKYGIAPSHKNSNTKSPCIKRYLRRTRGGCSGGGSGGVGGGIGGDGADTELRKRKMQTRSGGACVLALHFC